MMAVHPFANMFFPSRLDCFCSEYDRIMPQTTNLQYISQLSLSSPSHTPLYFLPFSCTMSLSCATLYIIQELANLFFYFLAVYSSVLDFVLILCKSFYIPPRYTCKWKSFSNCACLSLWYGNVLGQFAQGFANRGLLLLWMRASVLRHVALWAMINL